MKLKFPTNCQYSVSYFVSTLTFIITLPGGLLLHVCTKQNCRYICKKSLSQCKANIQVYAHSGGQVFYKLPVISDLNSVQVLDICFI